MAKLKFGEGIVVEVPVPLKGVISPPKEVIKEVYVDRKIDLGPLEMGINALKGQLVDLDNEVSDNSNSINFLKANASVKSSIIKPEIKEVIIHQNDKEEIEELNYKIGELKESEVMLFSRLSHLKSENEKVINKLNRTLTLLTIANVALLAYIVL